MPDPIAFDSASPRFALPLLFAGQAQKEIYVNVALALVDALLHGAIEGTANAPPSVPVDGTCWLVGSAPTGDWAGASGKLAARQGGTWLFIAPRDGIRLLNRATGQDVLYSGGWKFPARPSTPAGGTTIDNEARTAIGQIISALATAGLIPAS